MQRKYYLMVSLILLGGCANPYAKFYQGAPDARLGPQYDTDASGFEIYRSDNLERDVRDLMRKGYQAIGASSFNTGQDAPEWQLREHARRLGAHIALVSSQYTNTVSGAAPLVIPQVQTSYSQGSAYAYGSGGSANAFGTGTTTTYGSQTVMMPYAVNRYDVTAVFLAKVRSRVGITPAPIDDDTRRRLERNGGAKVDVVTEGTSAYAADVLPGDVILSIGGQKVESPEQYIELLNRFEGQAVAFELDRNGKKLEKQLLIQPYSKRKR